MAKPYQIKLRRTTQAIGETDYWNTTGRQTPAWWSSAQGDTYPVNGEPIIITSQPTGQLEPDKLIAIGDDTGNKPKFFKAFKASVLKKFTFWASGVYGTFNGTRVQLKDENGNSLNPYTTAGSVGYSTTEEDLPVGTVGWHLDKISTDVTNLKSNDTNRPKTWVGYCNTSASIAQKAVTIIAGGTFTTNDLVTGCMLRIVFVSANTANNPTLKIGSLAAKPIYRGASAMQANFWSAGDVVDFVYDNTYVNTSGCFLAVDKGVATTSYYGITKLSNAYTTADASVAASQTAVNSVYSNAVRTSGTQTVGGDKTFTGAVGFSGTVTLSSDSTGTTQAATDNSTKLATTAFVNTAIKNRGSGTWYGTSSTAGTTAAKTSSISSPTAFTSSALVAGAMVTIKFTYANTATSALTLNISSTGAKTIYLSGKATSSTNTLLFDAGETITFVYDGTYFHVVSLSSSPTKKYVDNQIDAAIEGVQIAPYIGSTAPTNRNLLWVKTVSATVNGTAVTEYILHVCTNPTSTATAVWVPVSSIW